MKKTLYIIAVCTLAAVSCQKEMAVDNGSISEGILTVTADIAQFGIETKTSIDGTAETIRPLWSEGDEIKLFNKLGDSFVYVVKSADVGKPSAEFEPKEAANTFTGEFACAYYPAANATYYSDDSGISANIPEVQAYVAASGENAGTFANGSFPMIGTGTLNTEGKNLNLKFKNVFGLIQLNFTGTETIKQIELVSTQKLSGEVEISADGSCTFSDYAGNFVDLTTTAETQPTLDGTVKSFYIAVPADSTISKIYVTTASTTTRPLYKKKDITVSRGRIASMASSTLSGAGFAEVDAYQEAMDQLPVVACGSVWAPVNCGYDASHTYGLLYQWGRKYGQAYEDGTITPETLTKEQGEEPANRGKFGLYDETTSNWFSGAVDNTLWTEHSKGTYDPCPAGWRVPTYTELHALIANKSSKTTNTVGGVSQNGYWFSGSSTYSESVPQVFISMAGCRYNNKYYQGIADDRDLYGYYWASSVQGNNARNLYLEDTYVGMANDYRAKGFSVRCVQE